MAGFKNEIDQLAQAGFEMIIYSFGSGFNLETADPAYLAQIKAQVDYAKSKGIADIGGYDLICQDRGHGGYGGDVGAQWDTVDSDGHTLMANACFASGWADKLTGLISNFLNTTGLTGVELDGPYGGGPCASKNHSHHEDAGDAVYRNAQQTAVLFGALRSAGIYINQPDNYFYQGGQRTGIGYNEDQFSLPRWTDLTITRQSIYDGTFNMAPTQGWTQVPLLDYHGGGAAAAFDPMSQHLAEFEMALAQNLGAGVAACYRGNRLFDAPAALAIAAKWAALFKANRDILTADVIHVRRADGQAIDAFMHADATLPTPGFLLAFNPTLAPLTQTLTVPLYYTGIATTALLAREGGAPTPLALARDYSVQLTLTLAPQSVTWFAITSGDAQE